MKELNVDDLFNAYTDEAAAKEATSFKTVPTGSYQHKGEKVEVGTGDDERIISLYGRNYAHLQGPILTANGDRRGRMFFDVSWIVWRVNPVTKKSEPITDENRERVLAEQWPLDKASKLWGQLSTVFDATKKPVREVLEMYKMYPTMLFVTETFETPEGWRTPRTPEERAIFASKGYTPKNFVQSISKVK